MQQAATPTPTQAPASASQTLQDAASLLQQLQQGSPSEVYQAARAARRELENQLSDLKGERLSVANRLRMPVGGGAPTGVDARGLEARLVQLDARISAMDKQIEQADATVARAAAIPGAAVDPPRPIRQGPPEEVFALAAVFMFVVLLPLTLAYARRIWRKSAALIMMKPQELNERFTRLEQSLDSIAVEVERVGESQRFLTKMQAQQQGALGAGPAERIDVEREREAVRRK